VFGLIRLGDDDLDALVRDGIAVFLRAYRAP
jgi:hypothetical protein